MTSKNINTDFMTVEEAEKYNVFGSRTAAALKWHKQVALREHNITLYYLKQRMDGYIPYEAKLAVSYYFRSSIEDTTTDRAERLYQLLRTLNPTE